MTSHTKIRPVQNDLGITIPKEVLDELGWSISDVLSIETENDNIILKRVFQHKSFEDRVAQYDRKIDVYPFDWGEPIGREIL